MKKKAFFGFAILMAVLFILPSCNKSESPAVVASLECESQVDPLGIDRENPLLQWKMNDSRRGAAQTAYQILVATSPELDRKSVV